MDHQEQNEAIETRLVLEAIHAKYGYDLRGYEQGSIQRRVQAALAKSGLAHLGELTHRLLNETAFFEALMDDLTVQVSDMFRDPDFYRAFREQVVPMLRTYPQLKVWHAGCATGEEVYAMAILFAEEELYDRTQIYATDIRPKALERAREGIYSAQQLESFCNNYKASGGKHELDHYYSAAYGRIVIKDSLRKNVVFFHHNLVTDHSPGDMHVILCRNVLIYFGESLRDRVLALFSQGLYRGGFLCLGGSEHIRGAASGAFSEFVPSARIYRRGGDS